MWKRIFSNVIHVEKNLVKSDTCGTGIFTNVMHVEKNLFKCDACGTGIFSNVMHIEKESFQIFLYIAGTFIGLGLIIPIILKPIYIVWMVFAVVLGWFMTRVILSLLFYVIITPIGLIMRAFGKDFLDIKKQALKGSYWNQRDSNFEKNQNKL
mgnify:CR=1 FL=1